MYRRGLWSAPLMLCYLYKYMDYVTSDMIHTSGDGTLDVRTSALEPGPLIVRRRRGLPAAKRASPAGGAVRPELSTRPDVFVRTTRM